MPGPPNGDDEAERAAYHEAGHALVGLKKKYQVNFLQLLPPNGGVTNIEENESEMGGDPSIYLAGHASEDYCFNSQRTDPNSSSDYQVAERVAGAEFRNWLPEVERIIQENPNTLQLIASNLKQKGKLNRDELEALYLYGQKMDEPEGPKD